MGFEPTTPTLARSYLTYPMLSVFVLWPSNALKYLGIYERTSIAYIRNHPMAPFRLFTRRLHSVDAVIV
jgi:hypothetical protein